MLRPAPHLTSINNWKPVTSLCNLGQLGTNSFSQYFSHRLVWTNTFREEVSNSVVKSADPTVNNLKLSGDILLAILGKWDMSLHFDFGCCHYHRAWSFYVKLQWRWRCYSEWLSYCRTSCVRSLGSCYPFYSEVLGNAVITVTLSHGLVLHWKCRSRPNNGQETNMYFVKKNVGELVCSFKLLPCA